MPGTKDAKASSQWFKKAFGCREQACEVTKKSLNFSDGTLQINGQEFHVGPFDVITLEDLKARLASSEGLGRTLRGGSGLTFHNIRATTLDLHLDPESAGAVFQVASLFNCLELDSSNASPSDGVTKTGCQPTQGSACASACPAATVFRNYFANGDGQQVECLSEVEQIVNNRREKYWSVRNGFCMPGRDFKKINARFQQDMGFEEDIRSKLKVGIHWDTAVMGNSHRVAQVFCSAAPVSLTKYVKAEDWETFAKTILEAGFEATLTAAACLARERGERVQVYLTPVGGGVLGNRTRWIVAAMDRALTLHEASPLDVHLVHLESKELRQYKDLETKSRWNPAPKVTRSISSHVRRLSVELESIPDRPSTASEIEDSQIENARRIARAFSFFDLNGDGVIDRREFMEMLMMLDSYFFSMETVDQLLRDADANGDGEVHYAEFAAWLAGAHTESVVKNLFAASLSNADEKDFENHATRVANGSFQDTELYITLADEPDLRRASYVADNDLKPQF